MDEKCPCSAEAIKRKCKRTRIYKIDKRNKINAQPPKRCRQARSRQFAVPVAQLKKQDKNLHNP